MKTLQEWKDVLERHGIECKIDETVGSHPCLVVVIDEPNDYWIDSYSDSGWAVLIARVTAKVFGEWAYYVPLGDEGYPNRWGLCDPHGLTAPASLVGQGPTKLDALYDAMARKEPQP